MISPKTTITAVETRNPVTPPDLSARRMERAALTCNRGEEVGARGSVGDLFC